MIVAGIGCRTQCDAAEIVALVQRAGTLAQSQPTILAAPSFRTFHPALRAAAEQLNTALVWIAPDDLAAAQPRCVTLSKRAAASVGVVSVAEGAALAAAGPNARLTLARISSANATCALAADP